MMFPHELQAKVAQLSSLLEQLGAKDHKFAVDLIFSYNKYGKLTPKQEPWIKTLIDRALDPGLIKDKEGVNIGGFDGVVALFNIAKQHLKYPKIVLSIPNLTTHDFTKIYLSMAGSGSKQPGTIMVMGEGQYPDRSWYGRVTQDGKWSPSGKIDPGFLERLTELLQEFGASPNEVAQKFGKLNGICCFCSSPLSDPKSTAVGYGKVCALHFGLAEQWKAASAGVVVTAEDAFGPKKKKKDKPYKPEPGMVIPGGEAMQYETPIKEHFSSFKESDLNTPPWEVPMSVQPKVCFLCEINISTKLRDGFAVCDSCDAGLGLTEPVPVDHTNDEVALALKEEMEKLL